MLQIANFKHVSLKEISYRRVIEKTGKYELEFWRVKCVISGQISDLKNCFGEILPFLLFYDFTNIEQNFNSSPTLQEKVRKMEKFTK